MNVLVPPIHSEEMIWVVAASQLLTNKSLSLGDYHVFAASAPEDCMVEYRFSFASNKVMICVNTIFPPMISYYDFVIVLII